MRLTVIGPGQAGTAIHQHACAAGIDSTLARSYEDDADVVILAVPDHAIAEVAAEIVEGPAVGMLAGALPLDLLRPHVRRFVLHPMQTIQANRNDLQLTGCTAGITAVDDDTAALAADLARQLSMRPLLIPEQARPLPHIACVFASNLLIAPMVAAMRALQAAGIAADPREVLGPLALRAVENALADGPSAVPTGPLARGDYRTIVNHRAALQAIDPDLDELYVRLSQTALPLISPLAAAAVRPVLETIA